MQPVSVPTWLCGCACKNLWRLCVAHALIECLSLLGAMRVFFVRLSISPAARPATTRPHLRLSLPSLCVVNEKRCPVLWLEWGDVCGKVGCNRCFSLLPFWGSRPPPHDCTPLAPHSLDLPPALARTEPEKINSSVNSMARDCCAEGRVGVGGGVVHSGHSFCLFSLFSLGPFLTRHVFLLAVVNT